MMFCEENDKSHEDNINELKMELEETFTNKVNEILNDKKELIDKLKDAENKIKELNNKNSALTKIYEEKIKEEKLNHQNTCEEYDEQIKKLNKDKEQLRNKSNEPMIKINKLLEEKSNLQSEIYKYKDKFQKAMKDKEELEIMIKNLEDENNNLMIEKENLISNINHIDSRIKAKGPKTTDMSKRFQNIGQSSMTMIRTDIGLDKGGKKKQNSMSVDIDSIPFDETSGHNSSFSTQKLISNCGICDKEEVSKNNSDIKDEERANDNKK
jgi:chromosome segregation ATPase